jgi:hypothetical protein
MAECVVSARRPAVARLRQWKREAMTVLTAWETVWVAAGRPGRLGQSKAQAMLEWVEARRDG